MKGASTLGALRDLVPIRPLTRSEAIGLAERQALRLIGTMDISEGPIDESVITSLARIQVERFAPLPVSGATHWNNGRWLIVLNRDEARVRQRFSLAHEFKHILDHRFIDLMYQRIPEAERAAWIEHVCDYFAGCLLMPRPWLKRAWASGIQDIPTLARRFDVSAAAMRVRLDQVGLSEPQPRCAPRHAALSSDQLAEIARTSRYQRQSPGLVAAATAS